MFKGCNSIECPCPMASKRLGTALPLVVGTEKNPCHRVPVWKDLRLQCPVVAESSVSLAMFSASSFLCSVTAWF